MKLPRSTENKITEDKDGKEVPQLGITEAISLSTMILQKIENSYIYSFQ